MLWVGILEFSDSEMDSVKMCLFLMKYIMMSFAIYTRNLYG